MSAIYEFTMMFRDTDQIHEARILITPEELDAFIGGPAARLACHAEAIDRELLDRFGWLPPHREWSMRGPFVLAGG